MRGLAVIGIIYFGVLTETSVLHTTLVLFIPQKQHSAVLLMCLQINEVSGNIFENAGHAKMMFEENDIYSYHSQIIICIIVFHMLCSAGADALNSL